MERNRKSFRIDPKLERRLKPGDNFSDIMNAALRKYFYEEQQRQSAYLQLIKDNQQSLNNIVSEMENIKDEIKELRESVRKRTDLILNMTYFAAVIIDFLKDENNYKELMMENIEEVKENYKKLKEQEEAK